MKIENIPADIKSKSLKDTKDEINEILAKLENKNMELDAMEVDYKRLIYLNKHIENLFKKRSKNISESKKINIDDENKTQ